MIGVSCFILSQFSLRAHTVLYFQCLVSSPPPPPCVVLFVFLFCRRVAERFIRHIVGCCSLFVRILNKLLSVPKSELCFICVEGRSWGIRRFVDISITVMDFSIVSKQSTT